MKKIIKLIAVAAIGLFVLSGCRTASVYNVTKSPTLEDKLSDKKVYKAIYAAGTTLGWKITKVKPGLAMGELVLRNHVAKIEIPYSMKEFSITYKDSTNLGFDSTKGTIHKNYNGWVQNLEKGIYTQLRLQGM